MKCNSKNRGSHATKNENDARQQCAKHKERLAIFLLSENQKNQKPRKRKFAKKIFDRMPQKLHREL